MKKFELTTETKVIFGKTLYRIKALISFSNVTAGDLGGWIEKESNLAHDGNAWVYGNALVMGNAWVMENAVVTGNAWVMGNARVMGNAEVRENARVMGNAEVTENARVMGNAEVTENAWVMGNAVVTGNAVVRENAWVMENARVMGNTEVKRSEHLLTVGAIGSRNDFTTFFRCKDKQIRVVCGCFYGTIAEFAEKVKATHGDSKHAKTYALAIELAKAQIEDVEQGD